MTDQLPERIWIDEHGGKWSLVAGGTQRHEYIPRAEADAMVGAVAGRIARQVDSYLMTQTSVEVEKIVELTGIIEADEDARAAFEQAVWEAEQRGWARGMEAKVHNAAEAAVREAVEAETERIVKIVAGYVGCDNIVDAIRAPQETSE